jgi:4-diphosphocytidyl-2-C-methyl-D-erythritol kinase
VEIRAYAKINLYLDVTAKRQDGYHELVTVMQSVSLADTLTLCRTEGEGIILNTDGDLPTDENNLICRAANAYFARTGKPFGISVSLEKKIPMQAGLGGGSADAAATLKALNEMDGNRFSMHELCEIGAAVGADVPFCIMGGTQLCRGIGEVMEPVTNRLTGTLVIAIGGEGVSTPVAFKELDRKYDDFKQGGRKACPTALLEVMQAGNMIAAAPQFKNLFEEIVCPMRPFVGEIKGLMLKNGAVAAMMSGSGPSVWGLFESEQQAGTAQKELAAIGAQAFVCHFK